jgi:hypothetical protein
MAPKETPVSKESQVWMDHQEKLDPWVTKAIRESRANLVQASLEKKELQVQWESLDNRETQEATEMLEIQVKRELKEKPVIRVRKEMKALKADVATLARTEMMAPQERKGTKVSKEYLGMMVKQVQREIKARMARMPMSVTTVTTEKKEFRDPKELKETLVLKGHLESQETRVPKAPKDKLETTENKEIRVQLDRKANQVKRVKKGLMVSPVSQESLEAQET